MAYRNRVRAPVHQARVFLPQWFMKVVRPKHPQPDRIWFHVPLDMGKVDIKNYLTKIYNIPVEKVHTEIRRGKMKKILYGTDMIFKKSGDFKLAYVFLQEGHTFKYPEVFSQKELVEVDEDDAGGGEGEAQQKQLPAKNLQKDWLGLD